MAGGCATNDGYRVATRVNDDFSLYRAFDDSHDWGPDYLAGLPPAANGHPQGDQSTVPQPRAIALDPQLPQLP